MKQLLMCPHLFRGARNFAGGLKILFGLGYLGWPNNPELLRVRNATFQAKPSKVKDRGWRAFQEAPFPGAPGPPSVGPRYGGWLLPRAQGAQRRLGVSLLAKSVRAEAGARRGGRTPKAEGRLRLARDALGTEEPGLEEHDFLASWARLLGPAAQGPLCGGARLRRVPKAANNSAMLPPAGPGSPGYTTAAEGEETGWRFFIVANIKLGFSPFTLTPYLKSDIKQINL